MTAILIDPETISSTFPLSLQVHFEATLAIDAKEARRRVNRQVVTELDPHCLSGCQFSALG